MPLDRSQAAPREGDNEGAISVALTRLPGHSTAPAGQAQLEQIRQRLVADGSAATSQPEKRRAAGGAALLDLFGPQQAPSENQAPSASNSSLHVALTGDGATIADPWDRASIPARDQHVIWPQIVPCWRPQHGAAAVKIVVLLDSHGGIVNRPVILRLPSATPGVAALQSEREAVRALWACAPYRVVSGGPRTFELEFDPGGAG